MSENPYQSPAATPAFVDDPPDRQLGVWLMVPVGAVLGAAVGAMAGGLGGLLLGAAFYSMYPELTHVETFAEQKPLLAILAWIVFAAYVSGLAGTVLGGILGLDAGLRPARLRRIYLIGAMAGGTLIGALIGMLGMLAAEVQPASRWGGPVAYAAWAMVGFAVGVVIGGCAGRLLGGLLARICWGRVRPWGKLR